MATYINMRILVVEDFATMRRIVKNTLRQIGFKNIIEADDGATALDMLQREKVDLIISDWNMPKMNGLELLKAVRADDTLRNTPFMMLTCKSQRELIAAAFLAGLNSFVVKPFDAGMLQTKIKKIFAKRH